MQNKLTRIEKQIKGIKRQLLGIDEMRPGSLTRQYRIPEDKKHAFYQISYTRKMKSHSNYVRREFVVDVKRQIKNYKLFKLLTTRWVDLAIQHSKLKVDIAIKNM